jgi:hypothetical protein
LILAVATFASTRSANRSARVAEKSLLVGMRPVLIHSHDDDPTQRVGFGDDVYLEVPGGGGVARAVDGNVYFALSLRNVGTGLGVIHGWDPHDEQFRFGDRIVHGPPEEFRTQTRDMYIAPGDPSFWQGAIRERDGEAELRQALSDLIETGGMIPIDILYGDHEGIQRWITRFVLRQGEGETRVVSVVRHWSVDGRDPRPRDD